MGKYTWGRRLTRAALVLVIAGLAGAAPAAAAPDSAGTDFWVGFMTNYTGSAQKRLFITGDVATTGTVTIPGLSFTQDFSVTPGTVTTVDLPANAEMSPGDGKQPVGVHVTAADEVTVYGLSRIQFTTDGFLGLPTDVENGPYTAMAWGPGLGGNSEIAVVASQNGTTATITPSVNTAGGHTAGTPFDVSLDAGDMFQLSAASSGSDLTGTRITATAPVSVFGGHQCANIPDAQTFACDHVTEQITPQDTWGTSFLTVPLKTRTKGDTFKFLASKDGTEVKVNGTTVANLDAGQQFQQIIDGQATVDSNKPILVSQFSNGSSFDGVTSDPFMMLIPPFEQFQTHYTVTTPASGFRQNFVNLVVPDAEVGDVKLDGTAIPASSFTPIGASGFQGAQVDVALGSHTFTGNGRPFGAFVYGFDSFDSYGYAGGLSLAPIARVTSVSLAPAAETLLVNTKGCVTATVADNNGARVPGVRVDFSASGANSAIESVTANDQGQATFCYTGANAGDDAITGAVGSISGTASKKWVTSLPAQEVKGTTASSCPRTRLILTDVLASGRSVSFRGAADPSLKGQGVRIVFGATGRTVATTKVGDDGSFGASSGLPPASLRKSNRARYRAVVGQETSKPRKLMRRLMVSSASAGGGKVTIKGRVLAPLAAPPQAITIKQRVSCAQSKVVATLKPSADGSFTATFDAPSGTSKAIYVLYSRVRATPGSRKLFPTKSLPRPVRIG